MHYSYLESPIGRILLSGRPGVLTGLSMADHERCPPIAAGWVEVDASFDAARRQLSEYFAGTRAEFDLELEPAGTAFQSVVWRGLREIPYGQTWSYGQLASRIGRPGSSRAVGAANGRNPIAVIVPCHRVIGADGSLSGFGWGTDRKSWLLDHERRVAGLPPALA